MLFTTFHDILHDIHHIDSHAIIILTLNNLHNYRPFTTVQHLKHSITFSLINDMILHDIHNNA